MASWILKPRRAGGLIAVAVVAAYANSLRGAFVFDDGSSILANPTIRHLWPPWAPLLTPRAGGLTVTGRPLLNLSLALNYAVSGNSVWSYHLVNLAIHALAALTLFGLVRRTLLPAANATAIALGTALLWAMHPLQTEAVTYVVQRAESLMGLFVLLTAYCFVRGTETGRPGWLVLSVAACLCGVGTKEVAAVAPLLVLLYDRNFCGGTFGAALRRRPAYYAGLAATWIPLAVLMLESGGNRGGSIGFGIGVGWWAHLRTQFPAVVHYLRLALWPHPLAIDYEPVWQVPPATLLGSAAVVGALASATVFGLVRRSPLGYLGAWFFCILAPTSLMPSPSEFIVEHRMYLPLAAVAVLVAFPVITRWGGRGLLVVTAGAAGLGLVTARRNEAYRTELSLWADTVSRRPANALAHEMLGQALDHAGRRPEGATEHGMAVRLNPDLAVARDQWGDDLLWQGNAEAAEAQYQAALRLNAQSADAHNGLGRALAALGRFPEAVAELQTARKLAPDFAPVRFNLAAAYYNWGNQLAQTGRQEAAVQQFQEALRWGPDSAAAHFNLANSLAALRRFSAAESEYAAALRLRPDYADAQCNWAAALMAQGRTAEAVPHYRAALQLRPDFADVRATLRQIEQLEPGAHP